MPWLPGDTEEPGHEVVPRPLTHIGVLIGPAHSPWTESHESGPSVHSMCPGGHQHSESQQARLSNCGLE